MNAAVLFICAWLANSPDFPTTETARQGTQRAVLDVVVFYAGAHRDVERYPLQVRQELQRFLERARAYRPRSRPADSDRKCEWRTRPAKGTKPSWWRRPPPQARLVSRRYVDALRPCYEWEWIPRLSEREASLRGTAPARSPETPFRELLRVLAAHRWLCAAEAYNTSRSQPTLVVPGARTRKR